jgi:hypothetical protein
MRRDDPRQCNPSREHCRNGHQRRRAPPETWARLAVSFDPHSGALACFVNGAQTVSTHAITGATIAAEHVVLGDLSDTDTFDGALDEVRVFVGPRSSSQILEDAVRPLQVGPPRGNILEIGFGDPVNPGRDNSKGGNDATIPLAGTIVPGIQGSSLQVNGFGVVVSDAPALTIRDAATAEAWICTGEVGPAAILHKGVNYGPGWRLSLEDNT